MEFRRYIALFRRWAWLILLGAIVAGGTTYLININTEPTYRASARFLIDEAPEGVSNEYAQTLFEERLAATYVELIGLLPVLEETVDRLDLNISAEQLQNRLNVTAPTESQIILVSVVDTDPERAALIANTVGEVFMDLNRERESARFAESITNYDEQLAELQIELNNVERDIAALGEPSSPEEVANLSQLETTRREAQLRYTEAFNNREALRIEEARSSNNLIDVESARPPRNPIAPKVETNTILGALVGAMLAAGVVLLIEFLDDTIKTPDEVREVTDISTVGAVAQIKGSNDPNQRLVAMHVPRSPISEAFRVIRTNLSFAAIDEGLQTLVVTSSSPGEGKSTISSNLAIVMAQTGLKIIIVDSDLRRPTQHKIFKLPNNQGLTTALLDVNTPLEEQIQNTPVPGLRILTSGPIPPNPAELLNSQRMGTIRESLSELADVVIFDTPPALTVADSIILAPRVSGCLIVVDAGQTRQQALKQTLERLQNSNAHVLGIIINQLKVSRSGYYYYDYSRYYNYEYASDDKPKRTGLRLPNWLGALNRRS
jgi:non-specific protein-tyrosine kinase